MNSLVDFVFAEMWRYTVLTFRILFWLVRMSAALVSRVLNRRQAFPTTTQTDLFDPPTKGRK